MGLLDHVVVPVATEADSRATLRALEPYLDDITRITAVHVIEKGGGTIDKAPVGKRQADGEELLATFEAEVGREMPVDTRIDFGTDVVDTIVEAAIDAGGTAIAFRPRGESKIIRLLSGNTADGLVSEPKLPVIALPDPAQE